VNTPTNTHDATTAGAQDAGVTGMIVPNDCYLAGKTAFSAGLQVRDCPHRGPDGQAWLRGWHVARLMLRLAKHLDEHTEGT